MRQRTRLQPAPRHMAGVSRLSETRWSVCRTCGQTIYRRLNGGRWVHKLDGHAFSTVKVEHHAEPDGFGGIDAT